MGSKTLPRIVACSPQDISPGSLQHPRVMKHFGSPNFDARILILILDSSMGRSVHTQTVVTGNANMLPETALRNALGIEIGIEIAPINVPMHERKTFPRTAALISQNMSPGSLQHPRATHGF